MAWGAPVSSLGSSIPAWPRIESVAWPIGSACCVSLLASVTSHDTMICHVSSTLAWALPQSSQPLLLVGILCSAGSVKLLCAFSEGLSSTGLGSLPRRGLPLRLGFGTARALGIRFCSGLRLQAPHGRLNACQAILPAREFRRKLIAPAAAQGGIVRLLLLLCLRHQGFDGFAQTLHFLLHIAITHGLVTRRIALDFRPIGRHVTSCHQPCCGCQAHNLYKHLLEGLQMQLAEIADGAEVRTLSTHYGQKGQVAFACQGELAA